MKTLHLSIITIILVMMGFVILHGFSLAQARCLTDTHGMVIGTCEAPGYQTPLKQFKSGIPASDVKCADGITLVVKSEDGSPACVKPDTAQILVERGWAKEIVTQTTINAIASSIPKLEKIPVIINGVNSSYSFNYTITGGQIEQATADMTNKELILSIKSTGNGILMADLPRTLIDAKMNGQDSQFIVLEDKKEIRYNQTTTIQSRILNIPFQYGVSRIEIIAPVPIQ
ncbi:MAG TPA: hypothetical protein VFX64_05410 [Candidatus Nitrosotalea sp.]|nr:hypothetical protein [Candidatus Nitrosotalea sp.]